MLRTTLYVMYRYYFATCAHTFFYYSNKSINNLQLYFIELYLYVYTYFQKIVFVFDNRNCCNYGNKYSEKNSTNTMYIMFTQEILTCTTILYFKLC